MDAADDTASEPSLLACGAKDRPRSRSPEIVGSLAFNARKVCLSASAKRAAVNASGGGSLTHCCTWEGPLTGDAIGPPATPSRW